jgi:hypothetical protein
VSGGSASFEGCEFTENRAGDCAYANVAGSGGAIYGLGTSELTLIDCTFSMNQTGGVGTLATPGNGEAIFGSNTTVSMRGCELVANGNGRSYAAYLLGGPTIELIGCTFDHNAGGGATCTGTGTSSIAVISCTFTNNSTPNGNSGQFLGQDGRNGGGMFANRSGSLAIINSEFAHNRTGTGGGAFEMSGMPGQGGDGAGVWVGPNMTATIVGSGFYDNMTGCGGFVSYGPNGGLFGAAGDGAGLYDLSSGATVRNCTFVGNQTGYCVGPGSSSSSGSGGGSKLNGAGSVVNAVYWANRHQQDLADEAAQISAAGLTINYSLVEGWTGGLGGSGNSGADPQFVDFAGGNFRLAPGSPGIDSGDNTALPTDAFDLDEDGDTTEPLPLDLDGLPRRQDDPATPDSGVGSPPIVDRGAYEFQAGTPCGEDCTADGQVDLADLAVLLSCFGGGPCCDTNSDGVMDLSDLAALLAVFGQPCP